MEKRQRLGKEREIMECVKDIFLNSFPHPKKAITYQQGEKIAIVHARGNKKPSAEQPIPILPSEYGVKGEFIGYFRPKVETPEGKVAPIKKELTY